MLKYAPLEVGLIVYDLSTGEEIRNYKINYNDRSRRRWLQNLCVWAWNNNASVEIYNLRDKELLELNLT